MNPSKDILKVLVISVILYFALLNTINAFSNNNVQQAEVEGVIYQGQANGFNGPLTVNVEMIEDKITSIKVTSHSEDYDWYIKAKEGIIPSIIEKQTTEVDIVSGATFSSRGIINAVKDALKEVKK